MKIAENETVWVTADTHFRHANILKYEPDRLGADIAEHDAILVDAWNDTVGTNDWVFHLGDFAFTKPADAKVIFDSLNGRKMLISGNHDTRDIEKKVGWHEVLPPLAEIRYCGKSFVLCHFPLMVWNKSHYGSIHLHGHSHGGILQRGKRFDVGVDAVGLWKPGHRFGAPVALGDIITIADDTIPEVVDHHGAGDLR